ncbi:WAT1-related protein At5g64700-like [Elaeis guineensis]|uniref:WAT1-related protein At5g64700-like n=1 Tax=Elaeis guineensis var. tenera TaxID=51953 RepID=UPI003C6DB662
MAGKKPYIAVVLIQFLFTGMAILSKVAFDGGMNTFVFVFYRQAIAAVFLTPMAIFFERTAPPLPFKLLIKIFMLSLFGLTINLNMSNIGIKYTSATVASAIANTIPVITFFLAVLLRIEIVKLKSLSGIAKVIGVSICIAGIMFVAFYKGPQLKSFSHEHPIILVPSNNNISDTKSRNIWMKGTFLVAGAAIAWSLYMVLQGFIIREYPSTLLFTASATLFSTFQSFLVAIVFERNMSSWKLHWDEGLLAVAYNGIFVTGIAMYLQSWCINKKGPVFVAMSIPLSLVITIACTSIFLGEEIKLGSVIGGALMVGGLYSVLWGKSREQKVSKANAEVG